ncbi:energy transducer TonB [Fodinibius sp. Rm-B-1B1-1]|uniref:energy transducer TonB n=1 Tax=Fodinibius alkaliphilus TaxID=3140241 RepID=UPI00315AB78A
MKTSKRIKSTVAAVSAIALILFTLSGLSNNVMAQDSDKVYSVVDQMPEIEGGLPALYEKIKYPKEAVKQGISGRVFLQVIVDENGQAQNPKVIRDIGGGCGDAAAEAITKVDFKPGVHEGEKVKVKYSLPVTFKIENR